MTDFKIGDVVRLKGDTDKSLGLIIRGIGSEAARSVDADALCVSQCGIRFLWASFEELDLVHRPDPHADIKQAIREVLLSDEFMEAFAKAWTIKRIPYLHEVSFDNLKTEWTIIGNYNWLAVNPSDGDTQ